MYHKIYNGQFMPYEAILLKGHLDENEVREALEAEFGDKDQVERLMRREPIHTYGKPLPRGTWWLTSDPKPKQRTVPVTLIG